MTLYHYPIDKKKAVMVLLYGAMVIDGNLNDDRNQYLNTISYLLGVTNDIFTDAIDNMLPDKAMDIINELSDSEKSRIAIIIYQMFVSDGSIVNDEQKRYFKIIDKKVGFRYSLNHTKMIYWVRGISEVL